MSLCDALLGIGKFGVKFEFFRKNTGEGAGGGEGAGEGVDAGEGAGGGGGSDIDRDIENPDKVSELELLALFDELAADGESGQNGRVELEQLLALVSSHGIQVKKQRRKLIGIIHSVFQDPDHRGDWTISREDWKRLVLEQNETSQKSPHTVVPSTSASSARSSMANMRSTR